MEAKITHIAATPLEVPLTEPFAISVSTLTSIQNVLVEIRLDNGIVGYGEAAPWRALTGESQATVLATIQDAKELLLDKNIATLRTLSRVLRDDFSAQRSARAGLEIALFDAWSQCLGIPLYQFFGGVSSSVHIDYTIPIMPPREAGERASEIAGRGFRMIKVKVGRNIEEDLARIESIVESAPDCQLIVDANQAYSPSEALYVLDQLGLKGIHPRLFEQPVAAHDLVGLKQVKESTFVPVGADESVYDPADAMRVATAGAADVINIKLMKCGGLMGALDIAAIARAANIGLMIGGMLESRLGMAAAAHLAAGLGCFSYVDLDTHMFLKDEPFEGGFIQKGDRLDLSRVSRGIGVRPKPAG